MNDVELLAPAGEWDSLVSAIQNGANAVYFGANEFNARINSKNFNKEDLKRAIEYAKLRNVKTHLTLNILIKNDEFEKAIELVKYAYEAGIDAVIVQDLGLAAKIIELFPDLDVHSSTQMTINNIQGVKEIEKLGFKRCVLSRELTLSEIKNICKNTNIEIEIFIHGALCICYSGQCLMSSIIGGRSGNRGKCAGTCRLPYTLLKDNTQVDKGYLLSSKDICTLDILPELINSGVKSFKIEGRMKSPEYVGIVTSIYRKYIDLANSDKPYIVEKKDKEALMQIFNRGGFSTGFLKGKLGKEMMYKNKPNHIGICIGKVLNYNQKKGYVKLKLDNELVLGDSISINDASCKISELMLKNNNIKCAKTGEIVTIGRINGSIKQGDKIYKIVSINLNRDIQQINSKENIKRDISCKIILKENENIKLVIKDEISGIIIEKKGGIVEKANNKGLTEERIKEQLSKLGNTIFNLKEVELIMDGEIITSISSINELRRQAIQELEDKIKQTFARKAPQIELKEIKETYKNNDQKIALCLNDLKNNLEYENISGVDRIYIPLRFFIDSQYNNKIKSICNNFNVYLLMPTIFKSNYEKININNIFKYNIKGVVISNLSQINMFKEKDIIANYTINITNNYTIKELRKNGITTYTISPELNKTTIKSLSNNVLKEVIVYGRALLMTTEYCTIGTYKNCTAPCNTGKYKLKDRLGFEFPIYTDKVNCNNLIYNSKITSIQWKELKPDSIRIDILDENIEEINNIINIHRNNKKIEGKDYTSAGLNNDGY